MQVPFLGIPHKVIVMFRATKHDLVLGDVVSL